MIDREEIMRRNPIGRVMESYGLQLTKKGKEHFTLCPFHNDHTPSMRVNFDNQMFYCDPCQVGGSVIDFVMMKEKISTAEAMKKLGGTDNEPPKNRKIIAEYDYQDEQGTTLYRVLRFDPKDFRQCRIENGKTVWNLEGVRRVLYRLPEIVQAKEVCITEGEKDVATLSGLGFVSTCNCGGAGKWLQAYTETLNGKDVVIIPDNDEAGEKHIKKITESLTGRCKSVKIIRIPHPFKDVTDWVQNTKIDHKEWLRQAISKANNIGVDLPIYSMGELRDRYREFVKSLDKSTLNFDWLPSMKKYVRGLVPGELVVIMADTGTGKTAIVQNLARHAYPMKTLLFELELADPLIFERFTQIHYGVSGQSVEEAFRNDINLETDDKLSHVFTCPVSKQTPETIEKLIIQSELKLGERPKLVIIDYIGLVQAKGEKRYERLSYVAEEFKRMAKATNTIVIITSQVHRKQDDDEIYLHDAKDSGSIENSAGLVIGAWRESQEKMILKILKNTKGSSGWKIPCNFDGKTLRITEFIESPKPPINKLYDN